MVAEDLLGANQPGEAGGGVVDGGGELEMFPSTALRTGFKCLDSGESFNEMFEVAAHCVDLVLEGCFFVHLVWWVFMRPFVPKLRTGCIFAQDRLPQERD